MSRLRQQRRLAQLFLGWRLVVERTVTGRQQQRLESSQTLLLKEEGLHVQEEQQLSREVLELESELSTVLHHDQQHQRQQPREGQSLVHALSSLDRGLFARELEDSDFGRRTRAALAAVGRLGGGRGATGGAGGSAAPEEGRRH